MDVCRCSPKTPYQSLQLRISDGASGSLRLRNILAEAWNALSQGLVRKLEAASTKEQRQEEAEVDQDDQENAAAWRHLYLLLYQYADTVQYGVSAS